MSVPPPSVPASLSTSGYEDGLGLRTLMFDRETGGILERLHLRPEFSAFSAAIRQRMERGAVFEDERFAHPRAAERDPQTGGLLIVSEFVPGNRLSDILENLAGDGADEATPPGVDAALGFLLEILPALATLHASTGFTHGAVGPGRIVVTPAGQVVLLDWLFGHTLERLKLDRRRLWRQFGIAMPPGAGASRFDAGADVAQAALTAVMIVIGRPLRDSEFPDGLAAAAAEVVEIAQISGSARFATGLQRFLHRALPLPVSRLFPSAEEADAAVRQLAGEIGVSRCRAALASFVSDFNRVNESSGREREPERLADSIETFSEADEPDPLARDDREMSRSVSAALEFEIELDSVEEPEVDSPDVHEVEAVPYEISLESSVADEHVIDAAAVEDEEPVAAATPSYSSESFVEAPREDEAFPDVAVADASVDVTDPPDNYSETTYQPVDPPVAPAEFEDPSPDTFAGTAAAERAEWTHPAAAEEPVHAPAFLEDAPAFVEDAPALVDDEPAFEDEAPALVEDPPAAEMPTAPTAKPTPRQRRRGAKRDRDKLRSNAKPSPVAAPVTVPVPVSTPTAAPAVMPVPTPIPAQPAPAPAMRQPAPPMPYYPPMFDPREPAAPPAAAWTFAAPTPPAPAPAPAPIRVKQAPAPVAVRVRNDAPSGYNPPPRRTTFQDSSEVTSVSHGGVTGRGRPRLSPLQWKLAGAAALIVAVGAGALARPYLIDRPQPHATAAAPAPKVVPKATAVAGGSIAIVTQPAGAKVMLDGAAAGETPVTLESVAPGRHTITFITTAGTLKKNIRVEAGKTTSLDVPVYSGWVAVFAPVLLDIAENGRSIGTTEQGRLMLSPGRHQLTFSNRELGYTSSQTVDIEPGEERSVNVQPTGDLNLNALPWAEVWIDGQKAGDTPIANLKVALGTHEITFKHPQFGDRKVTTTIHANTPASASVDFTKTPQP